MYEYHYSWGEKRKKDRNKIIIKIIYRKSDKYNKWFENNKEMRRKWLGNQLKKKRTKWSGNKKKKNEYMFIIFF